jgi:hypothetical protein
MASKSQPTEQVKAFRKAARELGCDENEERFQEALRHVGRQLPKTDGDSSSEGKPARHRKNESP